jgi:hypothetical protein
VTVDLVGDLNALVAEPAGDLGDRDALGQRGGGVQVAQRRTGSPSWTTRRLTLARHAPNSSRL